MAPTEPSPSKLSCHCDKCRLSSNPLSYEVSHTQTLEKLGIVKSPIAASSLHAFDVLYQRILGLADITPHNVRAEVQALTRLLAHHPRESLLLFFARKKDNAHTIIRNIAHAQVAHQDFDLSPLWQQIIAQVKDQLTSYTPIDFMRIIFHLFTDAATVFLDDCAKYKVSMDHINNVFYILTVDIIFKNRYGCEFLIPEFEKIELILKKIFAQYLRPVTWIRNDNIGNVKFADFEHCYQLLKPVGTTRSEENIYLKLAIRFWNQVAAMQSAASSIETPETCSPVSSTVLEEPALSARSKSGPSADDKPKCEANNAIKAIARQNKSAHEEWLKNIKHFAALKRSKISDLQFESELRRFADAIGAELKSLQEPERTQPSRSAHSAAAGGTLFSLPSSPSVNNQDSLPELSLGSSSSSSD